ncbi:efflux RND transporter permease subunit [Endozoicomonas numazuensis]|uniref:Transporter n=1 Tax=Endozoicomonas numazuensis TaxID=1137799 RepID=A0A081N9H5_9GAMM|nr:efflux RND transporter permease subunit [Endozoicomonas numazuensis]KEQ15098.1 transporter [Endozoicomonas numazuensis]
MKFTDVFIQRPVMAVSISLLILILGLQALYTLQIRQFPQMTNTTITVSTSYYGASSDVIQGFLTQPLQQAIAEADNIDYMLSTSSLGASSIQAVMKTGTNPDAALAEIMAKVNSVKSQLPPEAKEPQIASSNGEDSATMYISFISNQMTRPQVTDYLKRNVVNRLVTLSGISSVQTYGPELSMRLWLNPEKMAQHGLSIDEVNNALTANNYRAAAGQIKGRFNVYDITINTDLKSPKEFEQLIIARTTDGLIRLGDIAEAEFAALTTTANASLNGESNVVLAINSAPSANPLNVAKDVRALLPDIQRNLPGDLRMDVAYDISVYIQSAIREVLQTIFEASLIVIIVIFLFMADIRAMLIPVITIPFSLIGVCLAMQYLGFSINLLTLLAMVLAIGLVVDDAIVVVENIQRHIEDGMPPFEASIVGTREIASPVIVMTITLASVFTPIALLGGVTGALFREFTLTLAGSVIVSGIVALTLSPVMCATLLKSRTSSTFEKKVHSLLAALDRRYSQLLKGALGQYKAVVFFALLVFISLPFLFKVISTSFAPDEDQGSFLFMASGPKNVNLDYVDTYMQEYSRRVKDIDGITSILTLSGVPKSYQGFGFIMEKPWDERGKNESMQALIAEITARTTDIPGMTLSVFPMPSLPGPGGGYPLQMTIKSNSDYLSIYQITEKIKEAMDKSGKFILTELDLTYDAGKIIATVDHDKAGSYGISMQEIADTLSTLLADDNINYINVDGRSYKVIPQTERQHRLIPEMLSGYYVRTNDAASGQNKEIPLSNLIKLKLVGDTPSLKQMDQANAITIGAVPMPNVPIGDAINIAESAAQSILPKGFIYDFQGESRQFVYEGSSLYYSFALALIIVFLVLSMQFESFRDPLVIIVSVPLALSGALTVMAWGAATMNIYTQVGLLTLMGLITKHGILICEVAKVRQITLNEDRTEAVFQAARIRLRPILMTTLAMMAGVVPLITASGAGAVSRMNIGVVIFAGLGLGTLFTLFVLPTVYTLLGAEHKPIRLYQEPDNIHQR